jgi:hypothetical protein
MRLLNNCRNNPHYTHHRSTSAIGLLASINVSVPENTGNVAVYSDS